MKKLILMLLLSLPLPVTAVDFLSSVTSGKWFECLEYVGGGCCGQYCTHFPVTHFLPVLFIEVVNSPADTVASGSGSLLPNLNTRTTGADKNFEVRIWDISKPASRAIQEMMRCTSCDLDWAEASNAVMSFGKSDDSASMPCGVPDCSLNKLFAKDDSNEVHLVYDTEIDTINWRSGCRDLLASLNPLTAATCVAENVASSFDASIDSSDGADQKCVGSWGPLKPRQMKSHTTEIVAAAYAGYRALHIARYAIGSTGWDVGSKGKMQHVYPTSDTCFRAGQGALDIETVPASTDGKYGFVWWVRVGCCVSRASAITCSATTATSGASRTMTGGISGLSTNISSGTIAPSCD